MIEINGQKIFLGDFHGQWNAAEEELALLVAGLWRHGYDFSAFQSPHRFGVLHDIVSKNNLSLHIFAGKEYMYDWGHLTTVGVEGIAPPIDDPDIEKVLAWFKANSEWVIMAHPYEFMIDRLELLLDRGFLDAIELVNGHINSNRNRQLVALYQRLLNCGKAIPIVSGLDIHIPTGDRRPNVLYDDTYPTEMDIPLLGSNRTGVLTDICDVSNVREAIANRQTFIEIASERRIIGPPEVVNFLEESGYWEKVEEDLHKRRIFTPVVCDRIIGGSTVDLDCAGFTGRVSMDGVEHDVPASACLPLAIPVESARDTHYLNVVGRSAGAVSVGALKVRHPLFVKIIPRLDNGNCQTVVEITNVSRDMMDNVSLTISGCGQSFTECLSLLEPNSVQHLIYTWKVVEPGRPTKFDVSVRNNDLTKNFSKHLVFIECPYIGDPQCTDVWKELTGVKLSGHFDEQVDYEFTTEWRGDEDLSAAIRIAWNDQGLFFKMSIADDVLAPSRKPGLLMFGDCLQIGINPVGTEAVGNQSMYDIMITRGAESDGVEKAYMEHSVRMALEFPSSRRMFLDGLYSGRNTDDGFEGTLFLPFHLLPPMQGIPGYRFGLYFVIFDNDGAGLKTALQWPLHAERHVGKAWYVPYGGAWATVELGRHL